MTLGNLAGTRVTLEFRAPNPGLEQPLTDFFKALTDAGDASHFHPHPLTAAAASEVCAYAGRDLFYLAVEGDTVLAYGMLRGWDQGYSTPSLGIAVSPHARGHGLGKALMGFLHHVASRKGARRVRLKVYPHNEAAVALYKRLGYDFEGLEDGQVVGLLQLEGE
jgi:ribosomal-protein-alanine N-acetyltransferase